MCTHADQIAAFIDGLAPKNDRKNGATELVLNGDTVDFLAEHDGDAGTWSPFTADPDQAVDKLKAIVKRDPQVFAALNRFLDEGGGLSFCLATTTSSSAFLPCAKNFAGR